MARMVRSRVSAASSSRKEDLAVVDVLMTVVLPSRQCDCQFSGMIFVRLRFADRVLTEPCG